MDSLIYLPSSALGLLMVGLYVYGCWRGQRRFDLSAMVNVVLYSAGAVAGVLLVASTFLPDLRARLSGIDIYILIAGLAVLAVSTRGLLRDVLSWPKESGSDH